MLPLFLTRLVAEWVKMTTYDSIVLVGRAMSGLFDLAAVCMLYLVGTRLYNRRTGLLAAGLAAAAVLPIQLSHYFAVDSFSTVFVVACFYFALLAIPIVPTDGRMTRRNLVYFAVFGFVVGLAGACKVNTLPVFGVILLAGIARLASGWNKPEFRSPAQADPARLGAGDSNDLPGLPHLPALRLCGSGFLWPGPQPALAGCDQGSYQPGSRQLGLASQPPLDQPGDHLCLDQYGRMGIGAPVRSGGLAGLGLGCLADLEGGLAAPFPALYLGRGLLPLAKRPILALYALFPADLSLYHPLRGLGLAGSLRLNP